jgi:hypothetical protein
MTAVVVVASVFFLLGLACLCAAAVYYSRAKVVHARADELNALVVSNWDAAMASQERGEDLMARIQEHFVY